MGEKDGGLLDAIVVGRSRMFVMQMYKGNTRWVGPMSTPNGTPGIEFALRRCGA